MIVACRVLPAQLLDVMGDEMMQNIGARDSHTIGWSVARPSYDISRFYNFADLKKWALTYIDCPSSFFW